MKTILRNVVAVILGMVLGGIANMALVTAGPRVFPLPAGIDVNDAKNLAANIHLLEPKHFVFPFLAHAVGTLVGGIIAHVLGGSRRDLLAYIVGVVTLAGGITACFMIPAPAWFMALDLVVAYLPMAWLAAKIGRAVRA